jgi:hypothetical protein
METRSEPPTNGASREQPAELPNEAVLVPWHDDVIEQLGYGPRSMYVETCWLPVLGPTATWLFRRLGTWAEHNEDGTTIDMTDLAVSLGLGEGLGKQSQLSRSLERLIRFEVAQWRQVGELAVRTAPGGIGYALGASFTATSTMCQSGLGKRS